MNRLKNKGLTYIETIVMLTIICLVSLFLFKKIINYNEQMEIQTNRHIIQTVISKYANQSFYNRKRYIININLIEKFIDIKNDRNIIIEHKELSKKLLFVIPYKMNKAVDFIVDITPTGNMSKAFTIYIFGYDRKVKNKISFFIFQKAQILKINTYTNKNLDITYDNIIDYHYSSKGNSKTGWREED